MKCLLLHCRNFSYKFDHATQVAEKNDKREDSFENAMVVFVAAEKSDENEIIEAAVKEITNLAQNVKAEKIIINPFSHLTSSLAPSNKALELIKNLVLNLKEKSNLEVVYTSFGWYKSFSMDVFGHDGSQEFREF